MIDARSRRSSQVPKEISDESSRSERKYPQHWQHLGDAGRVLVELEAEGIETEAFNLAGKPIAGCRNMVWLLRKINA